MMILDFQLFETIFQKTAKDVFILPQNKTYVNMKNVLTDSKGKMCSITLEISDYSQNLNSCCFLFSFNTQDKDK